MTSVQGRIDALLAEQPENMGLTLALLVARGGEVIAEGYNAATDVTAATPLISWSMAKSFTHALVGIALRDGLVQLHGPAPVPEWADPVDPRHNISIDHLLHMRSGLTFNEEYVDATASHCMEMLFGSGAVDMGSYTASQTLAHSPGEVINYSSGTTNILCRILADAVGSGPKFEAWMREVLLDPLGIDEARLTFDEAGTWVGSSYLHTTAANFARFGTLYLNDGMVDGQRLLPEGWVQHGATQQGVEPSDGSPIGAHWWRWKPRPDEVFAAQGYECQRILVWPARDIVAVRLGKTDVSLAPNVDAWLADLLDQLP